jgi:RNA polymerase sigma factor (sigma-70 family)
MTSSIPPELAGLIESPDPADRRKAWSAFLARYNRLLLKAAASFGGDYDARMDRYRHMVEELAADDYRRLRAYHVHSKSSFPAWLTVVARRLCLDLNRSQLGRADRPSGSADGTRTLRRRLIDLAGEIPDPDALLASDDDPANQVEEEERRSAVDRALAELPPRDQLLLRLRYADDLPVRTIANLMGFPTIFHVYRRLRPLLEQLKQRLADHGPPGRAR